MSKMQEDEAARRPFNTAAARRRCQAAAAFANAKIVAAGSRSSTELPAASDLVLEIPVV